MPVWSWTGSRGQYKPYDVRYSPHIYPYDVRYSPHSILCLTIRKEVWWSQYVLDAVSVKPLPISQSYMATVYFWLIELHIFDN